MRNLKIVLFVCLFVITIVIVFLIGTSIATRFSLEASAQSAVRELLGTDAFRVVGFHIDDQLFDPGGRWWILLDNQFGTASALPVFKTLKESRSSDEETTAYIERLFSKKVAGYKCFSGSDLSLENGTVCDPGSVRKCSISICVKSGDANVFLTVVVF
jgi:hypothetical protein